MSSSSNSRKGTSITHLMNWNLPRPYSTNEYRIRNNRRNPTWGLGSGYHAVDKARYVNANYRFIVHPDGDYRAQAVDSDIHLPWDQVLQILASAQTQFTSCPICLSTPVAPRMARCGHIFCLPCLIRYMASTDDSKSAPDKKPRYKKCVICMDSVYLTETRPVRFFAGQENKQPCEGEDVVLRLVMRAQGSTLSLPRDGADALAQPDEIPWHFAAEVMDYARIMKGTRSYMLEQFSREIQELKQMEREDELMFGEEGDWTRKAVSMIWTRAEGVKGMGDPPQPTPEPSNSKAKEERPEIRFNENDDPPAMYHVTHEPRSGHSSSSPSQSQTLVQQPTNNSETTDQLLIHQPALDSSSPPSSVQEDVQYPKTTSAGGSHNSPYYFYQALLHYYLSPLDIRILKTAFGSYISFPSTILPRVENVTTGQSVDDDLRKRAKYLAHLPYGCEVGFLECDWTDVVAPDILERFKPEIDRRRKRKSDKDFKEEHDRIKAEKAEDEERWAAVRQRRRGSKKESFTEEDFIALATAQSLADSLPVANDSPLPASNNNDELAPTNPASSEPSNSSFQGRTVWGTPAIMTQEPSSLPQDSSDMDNDHGGWLQDWEKDVLLEQELLFHYRVGESAGGARESTASSHGKNQKKKFKKVTLMTNGGKRGA